MQLETINKLYLELSQITTARNSKEITLLNGINQAKNAALEICYQIEKSGASEELTKLSVLASQLHNFLGSLLPDSKITHISF